MTPAPRHADGKEHARAQVSKLIAQVLGNPNTSLAREMACSAFVSSFKRPRAKSRVPPPLPLDFSRTSLRRAFMSLPAEGCCAKSRWPPSDVARSTMDFSDLAKAVAKKP